MELHDPAVVSELRANKDRTLADDTCNVIFPPVRCYCLKPTCPRRFEQVLDLGFRNIKHVKAKADGDTSITKRLSLC